MGKVKRSRTDVALVMAASFFFMFSTMFINPMINGYAKSLGASGAFAGVIVGVMSLVALFLRPLAGHLTDRYSRYSLSFVGGILIVAGIVGYILTPDAPMLILFRVLNGAGYVLGTVCLTTWLAVLVPREHVGEAMAFYGLMNALAMSLAPAVSINLVGRLGYRHTTVIAAISACIMVVCIQFVHNRAVPLRHSRKPAGRRPTVCGASGEVTGRDHSHRVPRLIQPDAFPVLLLTALFAFPYFVTQADLVTYVAQRHLPVAVGEYFLIYAAILIVSRLFLRNLFDTVRFCVWFWVSLSCTLGYLVVLTVMDNNVLMALAAALMAGGYGIIYSVLQATAMLLAPLEEQGLASATFYLGLDIAMAFGPMIGGLIDECLPVGWFYAVQMLVVPLALIVYLRWRKPLNDAIRRH